MSDVVKRAVAMEARYRMRIQNQIGTINRLLDNGAYDKEMGALHEQLAQRDVYIGQLEEAIRSAGGVLPKRSE